VVAGGMATGLWVPNETIAKETAQDEQIIQQAFFADIDKGTNEHDWIVELGHGEIAFGDHSDGAESQLVMLSVDDAAGFIFIRKNIPFENAFTGRLLLSGVLGSEDVETSVGFVLIAYSGEELIFQDDMSGRVLVGTMPLSRQEIRTPFLQQVDRVEIGVLLLGQGNAGVESLTLSSVEAVSENVSDEITRYIDEVLGVVLERHVNNAKIDIEKLRLETLSRSRGISTIKEAAPSINWMLSQLGDNHSMYIHESSPNREQSPGPQGKPGIEAKMLSSSVGYLRLSGVWASAEDENYEAFHDLVKQLTEEGVKDWLIDLRSCAGGSMWPMLAYTAPLLDQKKVGMFLDSGGSPEAEWVVSGEWVGLRIAGELTYKAKFGKSAHDFNARDIAVLIGPNTQSSCEALAISFSGQSNVTLLGQPSAGLTTGNVQITLSDNSLLVLAVTRFADRTGRAYDGPVQPDTPTQLNADASDSDLLALLSQIE